MKTVLAIGVALCAVSSSWAQVDKWDIGLKYERNGRSGATFEVRRHFTSGFSFTGSVTGKWYDNQAFGQAGIDTMTSQLYYGEFRDVGSEYRLNLGAQYRLPIWQKRLFVGASLFGGYANSQWRSTYFTAVNSTELPPAYAIFSGEPTDEIYRTEAPFFGTGMEFGADFPLGNRLLVTGSILTNLRYQGNYIEFNGGAAVGLRYRFGKEKG